MDFRLELRSDEKKVLPNELERHTNQCIALSIALKGHIRVHVLIIASLMLKAVQCFDRILRA